MQGYALTGDPACATFGMRGQGFQDIGKVGGHRWTDFVALRAESFQDEHDPAAPLLNSLDPVIDVDCQAADPGFVEETHILANLDQSCHDRVLAGRSHRKLRTCLERAIDFDFRNTRIPLGPAGYIAEQRPNRFRRGVDLNPMLAFPHFDSLVIHAVNIHRTTDNSMSGGTLKFRSQPAILAVTGRRRIFSAMALLGLDIEPRLDKITGTLLPLSESDSPFTVFFAVLGFCFFGFPLAARSTLNGADLPGEFGSLRHE